MVASVRSLPPSILAEISARVGPEWFEWYTLTPGERWDESARLWQSYVALGGVLDPIADSECAGDAGPERRALLTQYRGDEDEFEVGDASDIGRLF